MHQAKNCTRHVAIAYYIYYQQRQSMMQCVGPSGKAVPVSLDPTLEARLLKERTEWMKRNQQHQSDAMAAAQPSELAGGGDEHPQGGRSYRHEQEDDLRGARERAYKQQRVEEERVRDPYWHREMYYGREPGMMQEPYYEQIVGPGKVQGGSGMHHQPVRRGNSGHPAYAEAGRQGRPGATPLGAAIQHGYPQREYAHASSNSASMAGVRASPPRDLPPSQMMAQGKARHGSSMYDMGGINELTRHIGRPPVDPKGSGPPIGGMVMGGRGRDPGMVRAGMADGNGAMGMAPQQGMVYGRHQLA